jgi:hypothetical protein
LQLAQRTQVRYPALVAWPQATPRTAALSGSLTAVVVTLLRPVLDKAPDLIIVVAPVFFLSVLAFVVGRSGLTSPSKLAATNATGRTSVYAPVWGRMLVWFGSAVLTLFVARALWPS